MIKLTYGNHKIPNTTAIFNMGTATDCPSKKLGLCKVVNNGIKCYAYKAEQQYKEKVLDHREQQAKYWKNTSKEQIVTDIIKKTSTKRKPITHLRINESGDFHTQEDVNKLSYISKQIKQTLNITTYGYTARSDLDFTECHALIKGSGHDSGNNGKCITIKSESDNPEGFIICPGSCKTCNLCKINTQLNISFIKH